MDRRKDGTIPPENSLEQRRWTEAINATFAMTKSEKQEYNQGDEIARTKLLKNVSRRVKVEIKAELSARGVNMDIWFNPKLKEQGRLDLK